MGSLSVCWGTISSQVLWPVGPKFSVDVGDHHGSAQLKYEHDLLNLKFLDVLRFFALKQRNARKSCKHFSARFREWVAGMLRPIAFGMGSRTF